MRIDNKEHQIFFSLLTLLGDNLGLNDLLVLEGMDSGKEHAKTNT